MLRQSNFIIAGTSYVGNDLCTVRVSSYLGYRIEILDCHNNLKVQANLLNPYLAASSTCWIAKFDNNYESNFESNNIYDIMSILREWTDDKQLFAALATL